jgi:hypothetical protein
MFLSNTVILSSSTGMYDFLYGLLSPFPFYKGHYRGNSCHDRPIAENNVPLAGVPTFNGNSSFRPVTLADLFDCAAPKVSPSPSHTESAEGADRNSTSFRQRSWP